MTAARKRKGGGCARRVLLLFSGVLAGALGTYLAVQRGCFRPAPRPPAPEVAPHPKPSPTPSAAARPTPFRPRLAERRPALPADFESAEETSRGVVAILIDDLGFEDGSLARLEALDGPLSVAVLPDAPRALEAAALAKRKGWDLLVHLPMAPESGRRQEKGTIGPEDDDATIAAAVARAFERVPGAIGLNNHQGSRATADVRVVKAMLSVVKERGLFFVDSRTTPATVAEREARAMGVPALSRDVFLDDKETEASAGTEEALEEAWKRMREVAVKKGTSIVIGHPHSETLDFLARHLPELDRSDLRRVKVSQLLD